MKRPTRFSWALLAVALGVAPRPAPAAEFEPQLPQVIRIGDPPSPSPMPRVDASRSGRSGTELPERPRELSRHSVGVAAQPPLLADDGSFIVALASPEVVFIDATGKARARVRLGTSPAVHPPVMTSDGGVAVLTAAPSLVFFSAKGALESTVALPRTFATTQNSEPASLLPTADGGVVVAADRSVLSIDRRGRTRFSATLPEGNRIAGDLLRGPEGLLVATRGGQLFAVEPPSQPRLMGSFGGLLVTSPAMLDERTVVAQVALGRMVALDLVTHAAVTHYAELPPFALEPGFVLFGQGGSALVSSDGGLIRVDRAGSETGRTIVDRAFAPPMALPSSGRPLAPLATPQNRGPLLSDRAGNIIVARAGGRIARIAADGTASLVNDRACASPSALLPAGPKRFALFCREGTLVFYGEQAREK